MLFNKIIIIINLIVLYVLLGAWEREVENSWGRREKNFVLAGPFLESTNNQNSEVLSTIFTFSSESIYHGKL